MTDLAKEAAARGLEAVRFAFADQHGLLRAKTIAVPELPGALVNGLGFPSSLLAKDTSNKTVFPVFTAGAGFG
ncbi:MAG: glutamine synthetase, partial [Burkholderiales bacterium]